MGQARKEILDRLRKVAYGDMVLSDDHNTLVDYANAVDKDLDGLVLQDVNIVKVGGVEQTGADWTVLFRNIRDRFGNRYSQLFGADLTVARSIELDTLGMPHLEVYASSSKATTFRLDVSTDGVTWKENYRVWSAVIEVKKGYFNAWRYIRLRSDPAGVAGDTVDLVLTCSR